jgi:hypothetical protein
MGSIGNLSEPAQNTLDAIKSGTEPFVSGSFWKNIVEKK